MVLLFLCFAGCTSTNVSTMFTPTTLRTEYKTNPLGIDKTTPRFDWQLTAAKSDARDQKQSAYRILVASTEELLKSDTGDLWDTGVMKSDETAQIVYSGKPLASEQRAYWKVRVWDGKGVASAWSEPALFSMGLLAPADWKAKWIGYDVPDASAMKPTLPFAIDGLNWMWSDTHANATQPTSNQFSGSHPAPGSVPIGTRYFRKVIELPPGKLVRASALISAEQRFELMVNGSTAGYGQDSHKLWPVEMTRFLHEGKNVIGIWARSERPGHFGVLARLKIEVENQPPMMIDLDESWQASREPIDGWDSKVDMSGEWAHAEIVGKLGDEAWGTPALRTLELPPPPYLRKTFSLDKQIARATLTASALGLYELHLNGQRVGSDVFTPGWTDYAKRVHYQTYDVTPMMKRGVNAIGAILGDGWYAGYFGFTGRREWYGKDLRVIVQLRVEYTDGSTDTIVSDDSWKATYGPIREADILEGCRYDANHELGDWDNIGFDDSKWNPVATTNSVTPIVQASPGPTVQELEELPAKSVKEVVPKTFIVDLGQNMVGWIRLKLASTNPGQEIRLRYAEMLDNNGTIYGSSARSARATDVYIAKGGAVLWEPKFTFHGFRYVEITGLDSPPPLDCITGVVVHSQLTRSGEFECSNPLINQLVHNIIWGQKGNYFDIPTDCPQRDERLGWTGDAQFFIPTAAYNFDVAAFFNKWLTDLCEDSADDEVPSAASRRK